MGYIGRDSITIKVDGYANGLYHDDIDKLLTAEGWHKIYDDSPDRCCENFTVVYASDTHELELWYDQDGYLMEITIRRKGCGQE